MAQQDWKYPLRPIVQGWLDVLDVARRFKQPFDDDARTCMKYLKGPYDFIWKGSIKSGTGELIKGDLDDVPAPSHQLTINKAFEFKALYGPALYSRNPQFRVTARQSPQMPPDVFGPSADPYTQMIWAAMAEQEASRGRVSDARAALLQFYLNYLPNEIGLKDSSRMAIDQTLIAGMSTLWPTLRQPVGSNMRLLDAEYVSIFDVLIDPDPNSIKGAYWWARRRIRPVWEVEAERGYAPGELKGHYESANEQGANRSRRGTKTKREFGQTNDLIEYWEIYSRMGLGHRIKDKVIDPEVRALSEEFGDYCYIEVAKGVPFPLNLPSQVLADPQLSFQQAQWPIPFYLDGRPPFAHLAFHEIPDELYPTSPLKPGLGELKFISWCMSYLATKIRTTCRDFVAIQKSAGEDLKNRILHGSDLTLIEIEKVHGTISEVVQFLQHPAFNGDIWKVLQAVTIAFEQRVGLNELMYAMSSRQMRSAEEASIKGAQMNIRPGDMLNKTEDFLTDLGRMWAIAARWHITGQDVLPILGPTNASLWEQLVMSADITAITREIDLRVESGSTKKPNFDADSQNMQQALTVMLPHLIVQAQQSQDYSVVNRLLKDWAASNQLDHPEAYEIKTPSPMPPPAMQEAGQAASPQAVEGNAA